MPNNWKTYKLGDIVDLTMGISPSGSNVSNNIIGLPLLNGPTEFGYSNPTPKQFTNDPKKISQVGDLLFCVRGSTTGKMNFSNQKYAIGRGIGAFRGINGYSTKYIKYLIDFYLDRLLSVTTGSTFPNLSKKDLLEFNILSCDPETANEIAQILSAIDDKIENNLAINKTLEEMAMALYKHWFVDFGPFQDGEFVESELGRIPKGWEVKRLSECNELILGGTPSRKNESYWQNGTIGWLNSGKVNEFRIISPSEYITEEALKKSSTKVMKKGTTVLAITGATLGQISRIEKEFCANQSVIGILESDFFSNEYIYLWIHFAMGELMKLATGGAQQHVNKNNVGDLKILYPNPKIMNEFQTTVAEIFENISNNMFENQTLTQLRDTLLPKLISGEVRLKAFRE